MLSDDIRKELRKIPFNPPIAHGANLNTDLFAARLFLLKRIAYAYENEIRIIAVKKNATKEKGVGLKYECESNELFQRIVIDPHVGDYTYDMLKSLFVNEYKFAATERNGQPFNRVIRSQLYANQKQATLKLD